MLLRLSGRRDTQPRRLCLLCLHRNSTVVRLNNVVLASMYPLWSYRPPRLVISVLASRDRVLQRYWHSSGKTADPLRILFCGSDEFSAASLRRLNETHKRDPTLIESIDVVCKEGRPSGRGLKNIRDGIPLRTST